MRPSAKRLSAVLLALALFAAGVLAGIRIVGRGGRDGGNSRATATEKKPARYHCPMHPAMVSDQPGDCPICAMRMVPMSTESPTHRESAAPPATPSAPKRVIYRSTMNPGEVSDRPGKDSMGMEMERVEEEILQPGNVEGLASVRIPFRKQQLIGVRTEPVAKAPFVRDLRTVGRVMVDETRIHHVHTKIEGWVDHLVINATGERVQKGQPLLSIYSPELLATQEEFLLALKARRQLGEGASPAAIRRAEDLVASSRSRLLRYDFPPSQLEELERSGMAVRAVTLPAPISGFLLQRMVTQGEKVTPESNLMDLADLSRVWVVASVYEYELPFVKVGQSATMTLSYQPGKTYQGKVRLIYPVLEESSRTVQVRLEFQNPEMELKPEMFAEVSLHADLGERLVIPESAVLSTGTRNVVFVARDAGTFEPRQVRLGLRLPDQVEVLEGLQQGEIIVSSGSFLIDSESKLKAAFENAAAPPATTQTAPAAGRR